MTQLTTRHKSVDKEEYDRIGQLLQEARAEMAQAKSDAESAAELQSNKISELEGQLVQVSSCQLQALWPLPTWLPPSLGHQFPQS